MSFEGGHGYSRSSWQTFMHHVVATANSPHNIFQDIRGHAEISVPKFQFSHQLVVISVIFRCARISTACKSVVELSSSSFSFASQQQLFGFATSSTWQRSATTLFFHEVTTKQIYLNGHPDEHGFFGKIKGGLQPPQSPHWIRQCLPTYNID